MLSKKQIFLLGLVAFFFIGILAEFYFGEKRDKKNFPIFDSASISGRLVNFYHNNCCEIFKVNNTDQSYTVITEMEKRYNYKQFTDVAEIGDSVNKVQFSETLSLLKKSGKNYYFTFKRQLSK